MNDDSKPSEYNGETGEVGLYFELPVFLKLC